MKKLLLILLSLPMIGFGQTTWTPCDSSFSININSQNSIEVVYSVSGPNLNMNSNPSWVYFNMLGSCIGGSSYNSQTDTVNINNNLPDSTAIMCLITDSLSSCIVTDTLVFDSLSGWFFTSNQSLGCTDSIACNYYALATIDDGSCTYPVIWYQTPLLCDGDSILVGSSVYDTAGNYIDTLSSANVCDSIVNTYLMIDENTSSYDTLSVTASIVWNGIPLNVSGDYSVTLINSLGCDSIVNLNLTFTTTGISDITSNKSNLVKITNMLGQETPYRRNIPLFYIYDDGTVEKRIVIE